MIGCTKFLDFKKQTDQLISTRRPGLVIIKKRKENRTRRIVDFAVPAVSWVKIQEIKKIDKYLKRQWNMKGMVMQIVMNASGTITKGFVMKLEDIEIDEWSRTSL